MQAKRCLETGRFKEPWRTGGKNAHDFYEVRYPVGVVAAISPFNFPIVIPLLQTMITIACGNTVVAKPSDRNPAALLRTAEMVMTADIPDSVFNVVLSDRAAVGRMIEHPDVAAITFVGSTAVDRHIRTQCVAHNRRVQEMD